MTTAIPDFVDVFRRNVKVGEIEHDIIANIFGILHGSEDGVSTAAKHDVKRAEVGAALVFPGEEDDEDGRRELDEQNGSDETQGYAVAGHEEGSGESR